MLFAFVLAICLLEAALALFVPQKVYITSTERAFFLKYDPILGWANREGAEGIYRPAPEIPPTFVRINAQGYRGKEVPLKRVAGKRRLVVLGDSNTFGYGIEEGERFTDIVAGSLSPSYEMINFGVFAFGTDQEALLLERDAIRYDPDTVLLTVSAGDLSEVMSSIHGGSSKPFFKLDDDTLALYNTPVPPAVPYMRNSWTRSATIPFFYEHSHLFRLIMKRATPVSRYMINTVPEMSEAQAMMVMNGLIQGMNDLCVTNRARFAVVLIPHGVWLDGARRMPDQTIGYFGPLSAALAGMGIPFIDTTAALAEADNESKPVFFAKDPVHLTPLGNRVVAQVVSGFLADRKLIAK